MSPLGPGGPWGPGAPASPSSPFLPTSPWSVKSVSSSKERESQEYFRLKWCEWIQWGKPIVRSFFTKVKMWAKRHLYKTLPVANPALLFPPVSKRRKFSFLDQLSSCRSLTFLPLLPWSPFSPFAAGMPGRPTSPWKKRQCCLAHFPMALTHNRGYSAAGGSLQTDPLNLPRTRSGMSGQCRRDFSSPESPSIPKIFHQWRVVHNPKGRSWARKGASNITSPEKYQNTGVKIECPCKQLVVTSSREICEKKTISLAFCFGMLRFKRMLYPNGNEIQVYKWEHPCKTHSSIPELQLKFWFHCNATF